jgi:hypothetical protein
MDYQSTLALVKQQNPELSGKEQQKKASETYQAFKKSLLEQDKQNKGDESKDPGVKGSPAADTLSQDEQNEDISLEVLIQAEKRIRAVGVDVNSVISIGREVIPGGELVKHDKEGVNTFVTFEDKAGNKLPLNGRFIVYI